MFYRYRRSKSAYLFLAVLLCLGMASGACTSKRSDPTQALSTGSTTTGGSTSGGTTTGGSPPSGSTTGGSTTGGSTSGGGATPPATGLSTSGNQLLLNGQTFVGRGVNLLTSRSCGACSWMENFASERGKAVAEVKRRIDFLQTKNVNFVRLLLETNEAEEYRNYLASPVYRQEVKEIMAYLDSKPGIVVLLSVWMDPSLDALGLPTTVPLAGKVTSTRQILEALVEDFGKYPRVMWGLSNEPHTTSAAEDQVGWTRMNDLVAAIRAKEVQTGSPEHVIAVQGLRDWARDLTYYVTHPITAGGGKNVVYETHQYNPKSDFGRYFLNAANTLPVIVGEFGPFAWAGVTQMDTPDFQELIDQAELKKISYLAWAFHQRCPPNLIIDPQAGNWCEIRPEVEGPLQLSTWGIWFFDALVGKGP